jgi:hypothetical protein
MISLPSSRIPSIASHFLPRALAEEFEYMFKALDLAFGLAVVLFESRAQLI